MGSGPLNAGDARRTSSWPAELVDVLRSQRAALIGVAVAVCVSGLVVAAVAPTVLASRPLVGAAVGSAALLLAIAAAVAFDAAAPLVRGHRHIRGTAVVHTATVGAGGTAPLVARIEQRLDSEGSVRLAAVGVGVAPQRLRRLTGDVASSLAGGGWRVLWADLRRADGRDGIAEVRAGARRLSEVVDYHPTLDLAEVGPGHDRDAAVAGLPELIPRLPGDVDVLLVTLPDHGTDGVLPVVEAMHALLVVAQLGTTRRSDVGEALDALDDAGASVEVVLLEQVSEPQRATADVTVDPDPRGGGPAVGPRPRETAPRAAEPPVGDAWEGALADLPRAAPRDPSADAWDRPVRPVDAVAATTRPATRGPDGRDAAAGPREATATAAVDRLADEIWAPERSSPRRPADR